MRPGDKVLLSIPLGWEASDGDLEKLREKLCDEFPEVRFALMGWSAASEVSTVFVFRPE